MAKYPTITSANSILMLMITGLFPVPQQIQGFSADEAFSPEALTSVETVMGVDGNMSAGWVPVEKRMTISVMPDSPSSSFFDVWYAAQEAARELYFCDGAITLPSIHREFVMIKGVLSSYMAFPQVRKVLQARQFSITWNTILPAPV